MYSLFAAKFSDSHFSINLDQSSSDKSLYVVKGGGVLVPLNLHKLTLVAPSSMRYDLHS
jgi:hypothetical protein